MKKYRVAEINENNIVEIATHFLESGLSLRAFASTFCTFSHVTLRSKFYKTLPIVNQSLYEQIKENYKMKERSTYSVYIFIIREK